MTLHLPDEIVVDRFLPTVRAELAERLHGRGLTQREIADRLGVTQAAVSKQLSGAVSVETRFTTDPTFEHVINHIADGIADGTMDEMSVLSELFDLIREFEDRGPICAVHEEIMPSLAGEGCDLCVRGSNDERIAERMVLAEVRRAARRLQAIPGISLHIPYVGTNIGMALPNAATITEVAAIPGRLYEIQGRVAIPANPEFGCSTHVAEMILASMRFDPALQGGLNLRTSDELIEQAITTGFNPVEFSASRENRREQLINVIQQSIDGGDSVPTVVYHTGAHGIEPVTYILQTTAIEAVATVETIVTA